MNKKCPGTDSRYLKIEIHLCPHCGYDVEMFSDEIKGVCPQCKEDVFREKTPTCIDWCQYARECLGEERWQQIKKGMDDQPERLDFREKLLFEMRNYFQADGPRILHAEKVLHYAEEIVKKEKGDRKVIVPAAILHDIGIKECERKYNSTDGQLQEKEGPPIARKILEKLGVLPEVVEEVCAIIASHHSPGEVDTLHFKILWDADCLVNLKHKLTGDDRKKSQKITGKTFQTATGRKFAERLFLG